MFLATLSASFTSRRVSGGTLSHMSMERVGVAELLVGLGVRDERVDELVGVRVVLAHRRVEVVDRVARPASLVFSVICSTSLPA